MSANRLVDYLDHMERAASEACSFVAGMSKDEFLRDRRTQQAAIMNMIIVGEAATKILELHADFAQAHAGVPWRSMRGMRNRIAHGYFDLNLDLVWDTLQVSLPQLLQQLIEVRNDSESR
ncbi:HepT-like ribonuclease domain-containing protein [Ramlibacter sp.]|uniref:HepT-like ribonuclease domain-containing protein n=1 Tax=Ramlibacter sp. TaxID=1917967 RepID=UPI003D123CC8